MHPGNCISKIEFIVDGVSRSDFEASVTAEVDWSAITTGGDERTLEFARLKIFVIPFVLIEDFDLELGRIVVFTGVFYNELEVVVEKKTGFSHGWRERRPC